jgi:hypothetical protein
MHSECSHMGHSKVRRSLPGASGTMRASIMVVPHFGHSGRTMGCDELVCWRLGILRSRYQAGVLPNSQPPTPEGKALAGDRCKPSTSGSVTMCPLTCATTLIWAGRHPALAHAVMAPLICWSFSSSMFRYLLVDHAVPAMWRNLAAARLSAD